MAFDSSNVGELFSSKTSKISAGRKKEQVKIVLRKKVSARNSRQQLQSSSFHSPRSGPPEKPRVARTPQAAPVFEREARTRQVSVT